jgi:hypothetical protein
MLSSIWKRAGSTPIVPAREVALKTSYKSIAGVTLFFTVFLLTGCQPFNSSKDEYWDKRSKAEEKCCVYLDDGKRYSACLKRAGYQSGEPVLETYNPWNETFNKRGN